MSVAASEDNAVDGRIVFELLRVNRLVVNVYLFIVPLNLGGLSLLPQDLRTWNRTYRMLGTMTLTDSGLRPCTST